MNWYVIFKDIRYERENNIDLNTVNEPFLSIYYRMKTVGIKALDLL